MPESELQGTRLDDATTHDATQNAETAPVSAAKKPADQQVLVVDDDTDIRETLRTALESEGYLVLEAADGLVALDILQHVGEASLVVLTNHDMPRLDGPGLLNFLADNPSLADQHAYIYMTASDRIIPPSLAEHLHLLKAMELRKPFELDALFALVSAAADRLQGVQAALGGSRGAQRSGPDQDTPSEKHEPTDEPKGHLSD